MSAIIEQTPAIFLMGPTAAGKTELAMRLMQYFPLEIISVDSAQIYREMNIGTAKPTAEVLAQTPHWLVDIRDPIETYSAAEFRVDALAAMQQISNRGRIPLLVGGTGLYFRALRYGLSALPPANSNLRAKIELEAAKRGWQAMHSDLALVDPLAASRIHPHDIQRIQRALEVWHLTSRPLSAQQHGSKKPTLAYRVLLLARAPRQREVLRTRIAFRFRSMLEQGLEHEVRELVAKWQLKPIASALRSVGYRQVMSYLLGECSSNEMVEQGITATRGLAKRQLTWLRSETDINWLYDEDQDPTTAACKSITAWLQPNTAGPIHG